MVTIGEAIKYTDRGCINPDTRQKALCLSERGVYHVRRSPSIQSVQVKPLPQSMRPGCTTLYSSPERKRESITNQSASNKASMIIWPGF